MTLDATFHVEHRSINGSLAEFVWTRPSSSAAKSGEDAATPDVACVKSPLIVVVPGFPGGAQIYRDFMLHLTADTACAAVCIAWMGQHPPISGFPDSVDASPLSLCGQVDFVLAALHELLESPSVGEVTLVGHSFGAWLASSALAKLDGEAKGRCIRNVHLFCPVLEEFSSIPRAQKLLPRIQFAKTVRVSTWLRFFGFLLPVEVMASLLRRIWWMRGKTTLADEELPFFRTLVVHLRAGILGRAFDLVLEAYNGGLNNRDGFWDALRRRGSAVRLHFAAGDRWTPPDVRERLAAPDRLPEAPSEQLAMPHGIVTSLEGARVAARSLAKAILEQ
eukprot:TRINITY_DN55364_c0_g1_i1.p1 TRINITY_DN55364_c0_g1~~TRINITY_DN55364_c0_g1_i1.p1  ORF type:complete len:334 (-),score=61.51 TRINITY_DN55364_c0_g1_i1:36-1037(-)